MTMTILSSSKIANLLRLTDAAARNKILPINRAGAKAVKLLVYYNPDVLSEVLSFQQRLVERVGKGCAEEDLPFLLELVTYPSEETSGDTPEFAKKRPRHTIESAREFSKGQYYVDILKL